MIRHFQQESTTFRCRVCSRRTRDTGAQSLGNKSCPECYELSGLKNDVLDGHFTERDLFGDVADLLLLIRDKGGSLDAWSDDFPAAVAALRDVEPKETT